MKRTVPSPCPSLAGGQCSGLHLLEVVVNLPLQLPQLFQWTFGQQRKVAGILCQNLVTVRLQDALHSAHLLNGLVQLFGSLNHMRILKSPFFAPGRCRTCSKNATACASVSCSLVATTISDPNRCRTRRWDRTL